MPTSSSSLLPVAFDAFKQAQLLEIRKIASLTPRRMLVDELLSEAWIVACEISDRRGEPMRLDLADEQNLLIRWLYSRFIKFVRDKRPAESLDAEPPGSEWSWQERLAAPESSDPLASLLGEERAEIPDVQGFSEFAAYLALFRRFELDGNELASHLSISFNVLRKRVLLARDRAIRQPSLFDGVERVDGNFVTRASWLQRLRVRWSAGLEMWRRVTRSAPAWRLSNILQLSFATS